MWPNVRESSGHDLQAKLCSEVFKNKLLHRSVLQAGKHYNRSERNV